MEERLDKLFKDKLGGHKVPPSEHAWGQINDQLSSNRKNKWARHLAVAASILLLISAGIVTYNYIDQVQPASPAISESKSVETPSAENQFDNQALLNEANSDIEIPQLEEEIIEVEEPVLIEKSSDHPQEKTEIDQQPILAVAQNEEVENQEVTVHITTEYLQEIEQNETEILLADNVPTETEASPEPSETNLKNEELEILPEEKTYPKVKITYKASTDSELVASNRNLIDKSIKKITKFSDERIMTDEVKTMLRNTKDDLLALNFGKLLNKSNKDVEN